MQQLGVVDLEQHAGDLASQFRVHALDQREEALAQHLLLLLGRGRGQHGGCQSVLARYHNGLRLEGENRAEMVSPVLSNKMPSAKFVFSFNIQIAAMSLKVGENVWSVKGLDLNETQSYSASHLDPSCLHMVLWSKG